MKFNEKILIIFLILTSIIGWTVFVLQYKSKIEITNVLMGQRDTLQIELTNLASDYNTLETSNEELNIDIDAQKVKIDEILSEVKKIKSDNAVKIFKYKKELVTMRSIMKSYIHQIDILNQKNLKLLAENKQVKKNNTKIKKEIRSANAEKRKLNAKIKKASLLQVLDFHADAVKKYNEVTSKASSAKKIRTTFQVPANSLTEKGDINFYIRISMPDSLILSQSKSNLFKFNGKDISYSAKRKVRYTGKSQEITLYWTNPNKLELIPGEYIIDVFTDGYELGTTTLTLEKSFSLFDW